MAIAPLRPQSLFSLLLLGAGLSASGQALSAELYVSTVGNDSSGTGTLQNPYRTVKRAISAGRAGDTITLRAPANNRTYNECDVRLRQKMTLQTYAGEGKARIHCAITTPESVTIQIDPAASGSRLSNLEISGGYYYGIMLQTNWYQGGPSSDTGASDVVLEDLLIHGTGRDGIKITPKSNRATIRRVEIHTTGARDNGNADGIDNVNGDGMVVEDSYIHDTATTGLYFKGGARDVVVQRNRVENTGDAGILVGFDTSTEFFDLVANPQYYESIRGIVRNNVVRNTGYSGIGMYASKDAIVANNTIVNAGRLGHSAIYFGVTFQDWDPKAGRPANVNPTIRNNLVIQDNNRCVEIRYSSELGGLSGLSGSPGSNWNGFGNGCVFRDGRPGSGVTAGTLAQWRSATGADANSKQAAFSVDATGHLPAGSPAIDSGTTLAQVTDDIDGQSRQAPYDLGADEYGQQSTAPIRVNGTQPLIPVRGTGAASVPVAASVPSGTDTATPPAPSGAGTESTATAATPATAPAAKPVARKYTPPALLAWRWLLARLGWLR